MNVFLYNDGSTNKLPAKLMDTSGAPVTGLLEADLDVYYCRHTDSVWQSLASGSYTLVEVGNGTYRLTVDTATPFNALRSFMWEIRPVTPGTFMDFTGFGTVSTNIFDDLATDIAAVETKVDTVDTVVDAIQVDTNSIETKVDTIDTVVDAIQVDTDSIETKIDIVDNILDDVETDVDNILSTMALDATVAKTTHLQEVEDKLDIVDTNLDTALVNQGDIEAKIDTVDTVVDSIQLDTNSIETKVDTLDTNVDSVLSTMALDATVAKATHLQEVEDKLDIVDSIVDSIQTDTNSIETKVDTIDSILDAVQVDTNSIETKVDTVDTVVDTINAKVDIVDTVVDAIQVDTNSIETKVDTTLSTMALDATVAKTIHLQEVEDKLDTVDTVVDAIQVDTNSIETKVDTVDTVVDLVKVDTTSIISSIAALPAAVWDYLTAAANVVGSMKEWILNSLAIRPAGAYDITFDIEDPGDDPLQAIVAIYDEDDALLFVQTANVSGQTTFGLDAGNYSYKVWLTGYTQVAGDITVDGDEAVNIELTPIALPDVGEEADNFTLVTGHVAGAAANSTVSANLTFSIIINDRLYESGTLYTATTDEDGYYAISVPRVAIGTAANATRRIRDCRVSFTFPLGTRVQKWIPDTASAEFDELDERP